MCVPEDFEGVPEDFKGCVPFTAATFKHRFEARLAHPDTPVSQNYAIFLPGRQQESEHA